MNIPQEISRAIAVHAHWKRRLRLAVAIERSDLDPGTARPDQACVFGQWRHALPPRVRATGHWKRVANLHAAFHAIAAEVPAAALAGCSEDAEDALTLGGKFSPISARLIVALGHWRIAELMRSARRDSSEVAVGSRLSARR